MQQTFKFGGDWTVEKLSILSEYLNLYLNALKNQSFDKVYIDAFAGSGEIQTRDGTEQITGSMRLALQAENKFHKYIFIEKNTKSAEKLQHIVDEELANYICERLESIFPYVANNPRFLYNTKMSPLFLFCFAVANPNSRAHDLAKKFAQEHILKKGLSK